MMTFAACLKGFDRLLGIAEDETLGLDGRAVGGALDSNDGSVI